MKRQVVLAVVASLVATLAAAVPSAAAATPTPDRTYAVVKFVGQAGPTVAVAPRAMMAKAESAGASATELAAVAAASGCWSGSYWVQGKNWLGWVLFEYDEWHDWCGDGTWITYTNATQGASHLLAGVGFKGSSIYSNYGKGWNVWKRHMTGHFTFVDVIWGTLYNYYPWMEFYVGGGGQRYWEDTWGGDASCSKQTC